LIAAGFRTCSTAPTIQKTPPKSAGIPSILPRSNSRQMRFLSMVEFSGRHSKERIKDGVRQGGKEFRARKPVQAAASRAASNLCCCLTGARDRVQLFFRESYCGTSSDTARMQVSPSN
jgi:hypothetical protein